MLPTEKALGIYWNTEEDKTDFSPAEILPNLKKNLEKFPI